MPTSLAQQLAQNASLNTSLLVDRTKRKPAQSYLFAGREADQHDLDSIYALAVNAFMQLSALEPSLRSYEARLFSETAKATDRTLQPAALNAELDTAIEGFLPLLGQFLMEVPTGKVIEWLVRRFRINEFNVNAVLALFMPYHESPHFMKMLSILHISESSRFAPLLPYKSTTTNLSRTALVGIMVSHANAEFARFIAGLLPAALQSVELGGLHRTLTAFHTGVLFEFVKKKQDGRSGKLMDEGTAAWYLPAAFEPMQACATVQVESSKEHLVQEIILSSFLLLAALSHTTPLSAPAMSAITKGMASCAKRVSPKHVIRSLVAVYSGQSEVSASVIPKSVVKTFANLDGVDAELKEVLIYAGSEKFVSGLLTGLISRLEDERSFNIILSLLPAKNLPSEIIQVTTSSLIAQIVSVGQDGATGQKGVVEGRARALLVQIQQRHPSILQKCFDDALEGDETSKEALQQALLSLSLDTSAHKDIPGGTDMVIASANADGNVRAIAVRDLYAKLANGSLSESESASIKSALLIRVQDTNVAVLEALYHEASTLLPVVLGNLEDYVHSLIQALNAASKSIVKQHLSFVINHLYPSVSDRKTWQDRIFRDILFPSLLYSKSRQKVVSAVWEILEGADQPNGAGSYELLGGCFDAVRWHQSSLSQGDGSRNTEVFAKLNLAVAAKIADNVVVSKNFQSHLNAFLSTLQSDNVYVRSMTYLVLRALVASLSGEQQIDTGSKVVQAMGVTSIAEVEALFAGVESVPALLDEVSLAQAVFSKPSSRNTLSRLQCAILVLPSTWSRPSGVTLGWVVEDSGSYVRLMRTIYRIANSAANVPALTSHLIRSLFITLAQDTLSFLAGVWLHSSTEPEGVVLTYVALYHAAAFLEAHHTSQHAIDFQTIVPAVLVALQHTDSRVREAALQCATALSRLAAAKKPTAVYAYDAIYGASSGALLYLDWPDFTKYIQALSSSGDHFLNDSTYLRIFHRHLLNVLKTDSKKESGFKQRVLSCLLSHVNACSSDHFKVSILTSLEGVSSPAKMQTLLSALERIAQSEDASVQEQFATLLVSSVDGAALKDLNDPQGGSWEVYKAVVHRYFQDGSPVSPRQTISSRLRSSIFPGLTPEHKLEVCQWLLQFGHDNPSIANECRVLLTDILEPAITVQLLGILQPTSDAGQRASKRSKVDGTAESSNDTLFSLSLLAEILGSKSLPGSVELISALLDTLSKVVHDAPAGAGDKVFVEQVLMSALENVALSMPDGFSMPSTVRLDILVELIRVSENPQTFNQALLLTATLAKLAPNAILHNIMPIFTFMGSNVFHRDDSYSFRVVQKTIDSIVPVMAASLRDTHPNRLEMSIASRAFLRIFTDAANHIPRHRRTSFFTQLVDALGSDDFLAPVCMLLVDKVSNRVARQNATDAHNSLFLPLSVLERYPTDLRLQTILELLHEARRLVKADLNPSESVTRFLELPLDEEASSSVSVLKRQALSVLAFVGHALRTLTIASGDEEQSSTSYSSKILSMLLDLSRPKDAKIPADDVMKVARLAVENALRAMSARDFVQGVLIVVQSGVSVQDGALELLGDQLANISAETRSGLVKSTVKIAENVRKLLLSKPDAAAAISGFHAVNAIANTMCTGEESILTSIVPVAVGYIRDSKCTVQALTALHSLSVKLGPRVIPFFKDIVSTCVSVIRDLGVMDDLDDDVSPTTTALNTLQALLTSIPKFWSNAELQQVVTLYLDNQTADLSTFMKAISKKAQSKILLPLMSEIWITLSTSRNETTRSRMAAYFAFLKKCIRTSPRDIVSLNLRALFNTFLDAFQVCASVPELLDTIKNDVISAFLELVVKLNEATFKPLFRKMFDWAFASDSGKRNLVFVYVYGALLEYFKGLMTPYMSLLLQPLLAILNGYKEGRSDDEELWNTVLATLARTFIHDEGAFWRDDRFKQLASPLVAQVAVAARLNSSESAAAITNCLLGLASAIQGEMTLKAINLDILMHSRSEDTRTRVLALTCSEALWRHHGGRLIGFVAETATFIAEAAEDANDVVVKEAHRLKNTVESLAGNIDV
ncbi:armadillo-type protein [Cristinia sonorae]|uniref:U3 small nucleolar RNA-associated protein 10 n=1 Tax=Cristinia sonorae TaxID=1940300 RepID=A0A8K0UFE3_9AGAR|nr:armadillo-type protein [Cristinia sonorae]